MTNYIGQSRTNYFAVKDEAKFLADMENYPVQVVGKKDGEQQLWSLCDNQDGDGWSWNYYTDDMMELEIEWTQVLAEHLADDWVAILMEVGSEGYRWFQGYALAVNNKGETFEVNLAKEIDTYAHSLGKNVTQVAY
jgi:hypothetical protein